MASLSRKIWCRTKRLESLSKSQLPGREYCALDWIDAQVEDTMGSVPRNRDAIFTKMGPNISLIIWDALQRVANAAKEFSKCCLIISSHGSLVTRARQVGSHNGITSDQLPATTPS